MTSVTCLAGMSSAISMFWNDQIFISLPEVGLPYLQSFAFIIYHYLLFVLNTPALLIGIFLSIIVAGSLIGIFTFNNLRNKHKALEKKYSAEIEQLSSQNQSIQRFIGIVSHDLRSPLNSISAISELLAMDAGELSSDEIEEYAEGVHHLTIRINHLVNNMLDANKIELGEVKLDLKPVSVEKVIKNLCNSMKVIGEKKSIKTNIRIQENLPLVQADENALMRVIENLMNNAYKFSKINSVVTISTYLDDFPDQVKIAVKDSGPGFTEADKKHLYQKFNKLSAKPTGDEKTTGLGLFIVHRLVNRMDGTIKLNSAPEKGSEFVITLNTAAY